MLALDANAVLSQVDSMSFELKTKPIEKSLDELLQEEIESRMSDIESKSAELLDGQETFRKIAQCFAK